MRTRALLPVLACVLGGCAHDLVLPDAQTAATCGDGVVESGEACDVKSPGCSGCEVVPGWSCPGNACSPVCGDGVVGDGPGCANARRETPCDMTGYWAARETDYERDTILQNVQASSNWYLYRFVQSGDRFTTVEELDCGVHVTGSATVDDSPGTLRTMMYANAMDGSGPNGARQGTSTAVPGGCAVSLDRWYFVRGAEAGFLPADFSAHPSLASLPPLPSVADPVNGADDPAGATDPDGDGFAGVAFDVSGFVSGVRDEVQRDWKEYADSSGGSSPAAALSFAVPGALDVQENVLHVSGCGGACDLLKSPATVAADLPPRLTLSFVGRTLGSPRVSAVVVDRPRASVDDDLTTCANVRLVLPHDPSLPAATSAPTGH